MKKDHRKSAIELQETIAKLINDRLAHGGPFRGEFPFFRVGMLDRIPPGIFDDRNLGGDECLEKPGRQIALEIELDGQKSYAKKLSDEVVRLAEKVRGFERAMDDAEIASDKEYARLEGIISAKEEELSAANAATRTAQQAAFEATQKCELAEKNLRKASSTNDIYMLLIDDARKILQSGEDGTVMIQRLMDILVPKESGAETANQEYDDTSGKKAAADPPCSGGCSCKKIKIDDPSGGKTHH